VGRGLGKWSAKIKIGQAKRLDVTIRWFLFLGSPYVSVFRNWPANTVKIGFWGAARVSLSLRHRRQCSTQTHDIIFWDIYDLFVAMFSPAAFAHCHSFVCFHLEDILATNSSQNGEHLVLGGVLAQT
jgi:hypothetical protein